MAQVMSSASSPSGSVARRSLIEDRAKSGCGMHAGNPDKNDRYCGDTHRNPLFTLTTAPLEQILSFDLVLRRQPRNAQHGTPTALRPSLTFGTGARA